MKRLLSLVLLASCLLVSGCGGGGASLSLFAGTWAGQYVQPATDQGDMVITVNTTGHFTGSAVSSVDSSSVTLVGDVQNNGNISAVVSDGVNTAQMTGTVSFTQSGTHMVGTVTFGSIAGTTFDLAKQ